MTLHARLAAELRARVVAALDAIERSDEATGHLRDALRVLDDAAALVRPAPAGPAVTPEAGAAAVLLLGDERTRAEVSSVLSPHFRVREAATALEAQAAILRDPPDLLLADASGGGAELCRALKRNRALASLPVVLLTDMVESDDGDHGADDVVVEPFHPGELVSRLRNLVALRRKERILVATLDELRERRRTLDEDLLQARSLQLALLPRAPASRELRVEAVYRPAEVVGGDLCDVHVVGRRHRFFLGDTTGHGLRASLQTMVVRTSWDRHKATASGPGDALARLNDEIFTLDPGLRTRLGACCFDVELDGGSPRLTYATAGHPPILLARRGAAEELWLPSPFVGLVPDATFDTATVPLRPGDRVIAYSDGLVEQFTPSGARVAEGELRRSLAQPGTLADAILLTFRLLERLTGGAPPPDDVTLIAVEVPRP